MVALEADEARHGGRAHRLRTGDEVVLSDGRGHTARAELVSADRRETVARVIELSEHAPDTSPIHLVSALPKGERVATLLAMTTQLGIASFIPLECTRSVVVASAGSRARWQRVVRENAKQSRQPWTPVIRDTETPHTIGGSLGDGPAWLLDPSAETALGAAVDGVPQTGAPAHTLLIGPEGGFTDEEVRAMRLAGAMPRALAGGILRIETAGIAAVAVLRARLAD